MNAPNVRIGRLTGDAAERIRDLFAELIEQYGDARGNSVFVSRHLSLHAASSDENDFAILEVRHDDGFRAGAFLLWVEGYQPYFAARFDAEQAHELACYIDEILREQLTAAEIAARAYTANGLKEIRSQVLRSRNDLKNGRRLLEGLHTLIDDGDPERRPWTSPPETPFPLILAVRFPAAT